MPRKPSRGDGSREKERWAAPGRGHLSGGREALSVPRGTGQELAGKAQPGRQVLFLVSFLAPHSGKCWSGNFYQLKVRPSQNNGTFYCFFGHTLGTSRLIQEIMLVQSPGNWEKTKGHGETRRGTQRKLALVGTCGPLPGWTFVWALNSVYGLFSTQ